MLSSSEQSEQRILGILASCESFKDIEEAGFLFHGTCETLEGALRPSPYDGVFWTARTPAVAQAYIPKSGVSQFLSRPPSGLLEDPVKPRAMRDDPVNIWALKHANARWEDLEIEERHGSVKSWRTLPGWPKNEDLVQHIEKDLGYDPCENGIWEINLGREGSRLEMVPADWSMPGHLILLHAPDLQISAADWQESEIGGANHNRLSAFERFSREGREAFSMEDMLQSKFHGNYGHEAIGILPGALSGLDWIAIPAHRHDGPEMDIFQRKETKELLSFMKRISPSYRAYYPKDEASCSL